MSDRVKLGLYVVGFILLILVLAWGVWAVFFRTPGTAIVPGVTPREPIVGGLPNIDTGPSGRVVDDGATQSSTLVPEPNGADLRREPDAVAAGGRTRVEQIYSQRASFNTLTGTGFRFYNDQDGRFYQLPRDGGAPLQLSAERFPSVSNVTWSQSGQKAVLEFPDGSNIVYDFNSGARATLPKAAHEFSFAPSENDLAYEYLGSTYDDRWVVASQTNGQGQRLIQPVGDEAINVQVNWSPSNQVVATFREPTSSAGEEVYFIGFQGENFLSLQTNGLGFEGEWSPKGEQMLYSVYSEATDYKPTLYIAGAKGDSIGTNNHSLRINTWPDKCTFESEKTLYCAVPQELQQGSGIFPELAENVPDTIYKIDLENNITSLLAIPETEGKKSFIIDQMVVSENGRELYFTDRTNGNIYKVPLR